MTPGAPPTDPRGGLVLAGRYQVGEPLGGGGSSQVFRGVDLHTKATVVLKLLEPGLAEDDPIVAHFEQEARLAARVRDPHLLGALDFGHDAGCRFIVYEHIPGIRSIRVLIDGRERITPERVGSIALQILSGLGALHEADIVHRDVSPGNCLWRVRDDQDEVVLADLGCAGVMPPRPPVTGGPKPSREGYGTAYFTAPEILAGDPHDRRADLWSVGALMYALLTSRDADVGEPGRWLRIAPPSLLIPSIPEELSKVVMTALAPQNQRYPTTTAMVHALRAALEPRTRTAARPWPWMGLGGVVGAATTAVIMLGVRPVVANVAPADVADGPSEVADAIVSLPVAEEHKSVESVPKERAAVGDPVDESDQARSPSSDTKKTAGPRTHSGTTAKQKVSESLTWATIDRTVKAQAKALRACSSDDFISLGVQVSAGKASLETIDGSPIPPGNHCARDVVAALEFDRGPQLSGVVGVKLP